MPPPKKSQKMVAKAEAALLAAIEIYNKPDFLYREETFSILIINAWELLLKAKLLSSYDEDVRSLCRYERHQKKDGTPTKRGFLVRNRTGNVQTITLDRTITELENSRRIPVSVAIRKNLNALTEVRDNAIHYFNARPELAKHVLEIGTASVKNFVEVAQLWFGRDFSSYNLYLMPIGFISGSTLGTGIVLSKEERNLVRYLSELCQYDENEEFDNLHVSLEIDLNLRRSQSPTAPQSSITNDPNATRLQISEEDIRKKYPWDYAELARRLSNRYTDFKQNKKFRDIRIPLLPDSRYAHSRYLDPGNLKSSRKNFYSSNILNEFDKHYKRAQQEAS